MPGITGFIKSSPSETDLSLLGQMLGCMKHEPFYTSGTCASRELGASAAWVSADVSQPCGGWNHSKDVALLFSGEVFSGFSSPQSNGGSGEQDTLQHLIALYEKSGPGFLKELNGWFSGLLLDLRKHLAILFNDRYGLGRVYHHQAPGAFFFSSEAKSLLKVLPETRQLDPRGLGEWLSCGCVLQNRTLFRGIELLPPGSIWTFSTDGKLTKGRYFDPASWESLPALAPDEYCDRLKDTFPRILKPYLNGNRPVGMSLTGGLDGRMIMSWSPRGPGELPCYTFNGQFRDCADVRIARKVARACGQSHQTIPVAERFFGEFPALAEKTVFVTDGAMDVTGAAELYLNRLAREIAPVRLSGNYGSEILRSNVAFRPRNLPADLFSPDFIQHFHGAARTYTGEVGGKRLSFIAFKQVPWHHYARFAVEQSQLTLRSPFLDNDLVALAFQAPAEAATGLEPSLRLIAEGNPDLGRIPTDRGITYPLGRSANRLRRSCQEFLAKAEYAYDYGMPDWLARFDKCVSPLRLERLFLGRQKFCHFRTWYRHQLSHYVQDVLLDSRSRSRSYLNGPALEPMVRSHIRGTANHTVEFHKLLSLELLHRTLLDPQASPTHEQEVQPLSREERAGARRSQ
jgi:asparagine synthase (glutamine-hydrolysing)